MKRAIAIGILWAGGFVFGCVAAVVMLPVWVGARLHEFVEGRP